MTTAFQRGAQIAREVMVATALRKRFGSPRNMLRSLGMDGRTIDELTKPEETDMPYDNRRRTGADRRRLRAQDANEDPVEYVAALMSEMSPEELGELKEMIGSGDRRRASDQPPPFPGRPNPGGTMEPEEDPLKRWRQPGEDRRHAADRRRFAHDSASGSRAAQDAKYDFERRFPSAARIRVM
jgi:hypothetical protein